MFQIFFPRTFIFWFGLICEAVTNDTVLYISCVLGAVAVCFLAIVVGYLVGQAIVRRRLKRQNEQKGTNIYKRTTNDY